MEGDPFDSWYGDRINAEDFSPGDWKFVVISHDVGSTEEVQATEIAAQRVEEWVSKTPSQLPGVDLLIARHKDLGKKDLSYRLLPFKPDEYRRMFEKLHFPQLYFHLRTTGGAQSGGASYHTDRDASGKILRIAFIIRPGHSSIEDYGASSAYVLSWDATTGRTTGFIDGITEEDVSDLKGFIRSCASLLGQPLTLPEIVLHMIMIHLNERLRIPCEEKIFIEERRTGLARTITEPHLLGPTIWDWDFKRFQESITKANKFSTTQTYIRRRFVFAQQLAKRFLTIQDDLLTYELQNRNIEAVVRRGVEERKERLLNRLRQLENYEHQSECMQKRVDNLITVLYTISSQNDNRQQKNISKINLKIAQAVRADSIPIRTIAYVTLVLLPGAYISSIFGMNFFNYDSQTQSMTVAKSFWQYWAVTIPVTIGIVLLWNYWVWYEKRQDGLESRNGMKFEPEEYELGA